MRVCRHYGVGVSGINLKDGERRRARLSAYVFHQTNIGLNIDLFQVVLSLFACACYVYEQYIDMENEGWWSTLEIMVGAVFATDYVFRCVVA